MLKFYRCPICGNLFVVAEDKGVQPMCCDKPMDLLQYNSSDAAGEKHLPVAVRKDNVMTITVGETIHPMSVDHHIDWVCVDVGNGFHLVKLNPFREPIAKVQLGEWENVEAVYSYCNLHGLWAKIYNN